MNIKTYINLKDKMDKAMLDYVQVLMVVEGYGLAKAMEIAAKNISIWAEQKLKCKE